jgi:hypothetical protein
MVFQWEYLCHTNESAHFTKRIDKGGVEEFFTFSIGVQGKKAIDAELVVNITAQKSISPPRPTLSRKTGDRALSRYWREARPPLGQSLRLRYLESCLHAQIPQVPCAGSLCIFLLNGFMIEKRRETMGAKLSPDIGLFGLRIVQEFLAGSFQDDRPIFKGIAVAREI